MCVFWFMSTEHKFRVDSERVKVYNFYSSILHHHYQGMLDADNKDPLSLSLSFSLSLSLFPPFLSVIEVIALVKSSRWHSLSVQS